MKMAELETIPVTATPYYCGTRQKALRDAREHPLRARERNLAQFDLIPLKGRERG